VGLTIVRCAMPLTYGRPVCNLSLSEYQIEAIPGTNSPVVNPRWRELDRRYRSLRTKRQRRQAEFAAHTVHPVDIEPRGRRPFAGS
jgi:hypothetical protein